MLKPLLTFSIVMMGIFASSFLKAYERDPGARIPEYTAEGSFLVFRVVPGDKTAKIFFVGKKMAEVDLKKDAKILSVFLNEPGGETLQFSPKGDYYEVQGVPRSGQSYKLSIRAEVKGKPDEVKVNINPKKP